MLCSAWTLDAINSAAWRIASQTRVQRPSSASTHRPITFSLASGAGIGLRQHST